MKVGVTGASGFIGRLLCQALLARGDEVVVLTRRADFDMPGVKVHVGDLTSDEQELSGFVAGLDVLFHCAGELKRTEFMHDLHVNGTRALLGAAVRHIQRSERDLHWIQLSSVGAYGPGSGAPHSLRVVDEQSTPAPVGDYEVTKTIADEALVAVASVTPRLHYTIVRPSIVLHAAMSNQSFFQLARAVHRRLFFYIGQIGAISTYIHADDVVRALLICSEKSESKNQTFIISNDCEQVALVEAIASIQGVRPPRFRLPEKFLRAMVALLPPRLSPLTQERIDALVKRTAYDTSLAQSLLGFSPSATMPEQLVSILKKSEPFGY
ncbi:nucleoside-diphosphate-sugar epimerase [Pseudomonas sp. TE6288]|uniref:NAD-dependent epimerase/dehydratase family protein n=1 Tax=Pseudomonas hunanensis TaxID=1247546 RepID=UPI0024050D17|nr:NAD-dependent epimerase/dehydratase family protein [Pseudomonas hunanensis]MDF9755719.1 nucleoside-diphosphate-sugar epimerase [Pseudomonas hunanensis]